MNIYDYCEMSKEKRFFSSLEMDFSEQEQILLDQFCDSEIDIQNKNIAFSCILDVIMDNGKEEVLNETLIHKLINKEIALSTLAHLNLNDKWLIAIHQKNHWLFECMITVYKRNIMNETSLSAFISIVSENFNLLSVFYVLIDLSNCNSFSIEQLQKIIYLTNTYVTKNEQYSFMTKYSEYFYHVYNKIISSNPVSINKVFCKEDYSKLLKIRHLLLK